MAFASSAKEEPMPYTYPDEPTNRPDPILKDGRKAPDARKSARSYAPIVLAVLAFLGLATVAALTTNESEEQVERGKAAQQADR